MKMMTPLILELLLHCYHSPEPHPRADTRAIRDGIEFLSAHEMIEPCGRGWKSTEKAKIWILHILSVPFPVKRWEFPAQIDSAR